jgi:hypothetical protein
MRDNQMPRLASFGDEVDEILLLLFRLSCRKVNEYKIYISVLGYNQFILHNDA